ncbi:hypothetical protein GQ457_09G028700 [Hibiscus cannabinus]
MQGKTFCFAVVAMAVLLLAAAVAHACLPMVNDGLTRNCLNDGGKVCFGFRIAVGCFGARVCRRHCRGDASIVFSRGGVGFSPLCDVMALFACFLVLLCLVQFRKVFNETHNLGERCV